MKRYLGGALFIALLWLVGGALAETTEITWQGNCGAIVYPNNINGTNCLLLPAAANPAELVLYSGASGRMTVAGNTGESITVSSGEAFDFTSLFYREPEDGKYHATFTFESGETETLTVMFSADISSLFILSDDQDNHGRAWVDGSEHHETAASGDAVMLRADGSVIYNGGLKEIRGRGNSTWGNYPLTYETKTTVNKKPYQITLSRAADLLDTGNAHNENKQWILLAEYYDATMLHNRIAYDLARALGQTDAPDCQTVDLYYDGEYRGQYLLTEKVEVGDGRVEAENYDDILKKFNNKVGIDLDMLEQTKTETDDGVSVAALDGVEDGDETNLGAYLVELDNAYYSEENAYFGLSNGMYFTIKNPKHASVNMVSYIGGLFSNLDAALTNYGVNPETGENWNELLDAESVLPYYWVNKLAKNPDTWLSSSTYFVLPEGSTKVQMGPVWDFDQAFYRRYSENSSVADSLTLPNGVDSWAHDLERIPEFQTLSKTFFVQKLAPAVRNVLLGDENPVSGGLHSLAWYWQQTAASRKMNDILWKPESIFGTVVAETREENYQALRSFIKDRFAWLEQDIAQWPGEESAKNIAISLSVPYGNTGERLCATLDDLHTNAEQPQVQLTQISEATEDEDAVWQADLTVESKPGCALAEDATITVNGVCVPASPCEDGTVTVSVQFDDPSYWPAEYDGTDYGLVFNAEYYAEHNADAAAAAGDDPDALLAYYVETGIARGDVANVFFDPKEVLANVPDITDLYGDDFEAAVTYFLESGYEDLMSTLDRSYTPTVWATAFEK